MQLLQHSDPSSSSSSSYIEGFLIGTKPNANGWQVSKATLSKLVNGFIGTPFTIIPERIAHGQDAHFHGTTKQETQEGYKHYQHGTIEKITGPFRYDDGSDDFYYNHITKLSGSKSAALLQQIGLSNTKLPFATSPHIWQEDATISNLVEQFTPIGVSLVYEGAFGEMSVLNRICNGPEAACHRSLGANHCRCCANTDENVTKILSSLCSKSASTKEITVSENTTQNNTTQTPTQSSGTVFYQPQTNPINNPTVNPQQQLTQEPQSTKNPNQISLTKEQYDEYVNKQKEYDDIKSKLANLENEHKTNVLTGIFSSELVTDETTRNNLIEKWKAQDVKLIKDLYQDFQATIVPALIERAKKLESETKTNTAETSKPTESKAANKLRPEPKDESEASKAAATVAEPQPVNEVQLLRKYLFSGAL